MGVKNREVPNFLYRWLREHKQSMWIFLIYGNCGFLEFLKVKGCLFPFIYTSGILFTASFTYGGYRNALLWDKWSEENCELL